MALLSPAKGNDPLSHQKCLQFLRDRSIHVLVSHNVTESYSGDGLIVASTRAKDSKIAIDLSRNHATNCLFREMEYDLADAWGKINHQERELKNLQSYLDNVRKNSWQRKIKDLIKGRIRRF